MITTQAPKTLQIKRLLLSKGITQEDIAKEFGKSKSLISQAISEKPKKLPVLQKEIIKYLKSL